MFLLTAIKTAFYRKLLPTRPEGAAKRIRTKDLVSLLKFLQTSVPCYRGLLSGTEITSANCLGILRSLPVVSKEDLRDAPDHRALFVGEDWSGWRNTGGSTGEPFRFPVGGLSRWAPDREQLCQAWLYREMTGRFEPRIVSVDGSRVDESDRARGVFWVSGRPNFPYGSIHFSTLYLTAETFAAYARKLDEAAPEVIRGYPSGVAELARLAEDSGHTFRFTPKGIYLTSENITEAHIEVIERVFGCPVWGQYGHSESSVFAVRRPGDEAYECHPAAGIVEVLRPDGTHAERGETGEIVVTGFSNRAMPFVRYRTGDLAEYGGRRGAFTILNRLVGRDTDFITDRSGRRHHLVGLVFGGHLPAFNHIDGWQIEQTAPGRVRLYVVRGKSYTDDVEHELTRFFSSHGFEASVSYVGTLRKTARGKQPFLIKNRES